MQQALESLFADLLLARHVPSRDTLAESCRTHQVSREDELALVENFERLLVYRELVRGNLLEALELAIPRTIKRLGALFGEYFDHFLAEQSPRTHYLRDVTPELLEWCRPRWAADPRVPSYLHDLGVHESLQIEISALPALPRGHAPAPLELALGVELCQAARLVHYGHAVHELPADENDITEPDRRDVELFVYRSPEHEVRYLEATPLARGILARLVEGQTLADSLQQAAADSGVALTETVLAGAAKLLADLAERGVIWGPRPAPAGRPEP